MKIADAGKWINARLSPVLVAMTFLFAGLLRSAGAENLNLKLGNPSQATDDPRNEDNFLMEKEYFTLSYNNAKGTPNWVSWHLEQSDLGDAPRRSFHPDGTLPNGFRHITPKDYTGSGFERGHMCPHSDRDATPQMSESTFVMSNIIPQSPRVNEKAWAQLETYCRALVERERKVLYIISGPAGQGGVGSEGPAGIIGKRLKVVVPATCWKVIMVLDADNRDDLQKVNRRTRLIAVIMPNDMSVGEDWARFRVPVSKVEQLTGYKFFSAVPAKIIEPLKARADRVRIPTPRAIQHRPRKF